MAVTGALTLAEPAHADPGGVVISELNYHAGSDLDGDDFLELTNTSAAAIDMSGWSFTAGITAVLPPGTAVPAGGRLVLAKDATQFQTTYGFAPAALYGGNLSNGGETVTLADGALATIDTVTYTDLPPWPSTPDGTGPSLELRDLLSDNTAAASWGPSLANGGTPGARNSLDGTGPAPLVLALTANPARPAANQSVVVSARLRVGSTARLTYKVMFGSDANVPFQDNAASPGGAGDGVYSGTIPGQSAGKLIRYRIDATSGTVAYSAPAKGDSARYRGVVVRNSAVTSQLPIIEWFMADAVYNDILANHRYDDVPGAAVWAYNGQVIDGALMSVRGNSSRAAAHVNWKVELPKGYEFDLGGKLSYPLDEFALQNYSDNFADVGWATVDTAGARSLNIEPVRSQRNGAFWGLGRIMETMDGRWRTDQDVETWSIYKGEGGALSRTSSPAVLEANLWLNKKTRKDEDFTDAWNLTNAIGGSASATQQAWIYQNVNIPELVNYMAINSIMRHADSGSFNWWIARDTEGTGRWDMWHWDLNWIFTTASSDGKGLFLTPDTNNRFTQAMLKYPEIREMFYRRLRTLADQYLTAGKYEAQWDAISLRTTPDWNLNRAKWAGYTPSDARNAFLRGLADRRSAITNNTGAGKLVPTSQSSTANVVINEIQYSPTGTGGEFIELANPGGTAVDISGWTIDAVGLTIQAGTVIPAASRVVFVANDKAFRQAHTGANRFVGGEFRGALENLGEAVVLKQGTRVVDTVTYANQAPWPAAAAGTGPSLELSSPTADNSVAANWRATSTTGGTPGLANTAGGPAGTALAKDSFTRTVAGGLGSAETGGTWTIPATASAYAVNGGSARVTSPVGSNRKAYLNGVSSTDTEVRATATFTRPSASSVYVGLVGRRVGASEYGARVVIGPSGSVALQIQRNTDTVLKSATVSGLTFASGNSLQFRLQVVGTSPTTIRAKVWKVGATEPSTWPVTITDSTAGLQTAGSIGLYSYLSRTATPTSSVISYDNLWAGRPTG